MNRREKKRERMDGWTLGKPVWNAACATPSRRDPGLISGAFVAAAAQRAQPTGAKRAPSGATRACRIPYSARVSGNPALGWAGAGWMGDGAPTEAACLIGRD